MTSLPVCERIRMMSIFCGWAAILMSFFPAVRETVAYEGPRVTQSPRLVWLSSEVACWHKIEGRIEWPKEYNNPYDPKEVAVDVIITAPDGKSYVQPAFWMEDFTWRAMGRERGGEWFYPQGKPKWLVRFTPRLAGRYKATVRIRDRDEAAESSTTTFQCVDAPGRGFLGVSKTDPRFLALDDGTPFFAIGQNLAFIGSNSQYFTLSGAIDAFEKLRSNGANFLRIWTCCEDWAMCIEGRKSAWGRSWAWHPPWIDRPAQVLAPDFRGFVRLAHVFGAKVIPLTAKALQPDPSHRVAVQPNTSYTWSIAVWADGVAKINCRLLGQNIVFPLRPDEVARWVVKEAKITSGQDSWWLGPVEISAEGVGGSSPTVYLAGLSLRDPTTERELLWEAEIDRPLLGRYNAVDCFMLDQLVAAAEAKGIYLQLCLLTRDLFMHRLREPASEWYRGAIADAKRTFRYAVARWGYSPAVAAWEYWNEIDPGLPTDRFYEELGQYLEEIDPYHHLRTTSAWGPSPKDCRHPRLDIAEVHYYLRPQDRERIRDEVAAVLDRTAFLRQHAADKPVLIGEFGLADDKWREDPQMPQDKGLLHFHNSLWASLLSGVSGTTMFWWWDRLDRMNAYPHYLPVARFAAEIPFTRKALQPVFWRDEPAGIRVLGLAADKCGYYWIVRDRGTWLSQLRGEAPPQPSTARVVLPGLMAGRYRVTWWDTWQGTKTAEAQVDIEKEGETVAIETTAFTTDVALQMEKD
ncbi:MAG: DUF5060 domain-containing protein [Thermogutta sp.]